MGHDKKESRSRDHVRWLSQYPVRTFSEAIDWHPQRMLLYPNNDQKKQKTLVYHIYFFFSDNLGGSLLIPTRGFRSHGGTTSSHPFLIGSFHYKPSMFILGHPQPFSNTPKRKRNVQPQMRSSKGDQTWVSGRSSYRWIPCEKNWWRWFPQQFFDDFPWRKPCCNNFVEVFDDCHGADVGMGSFFCNSGGSHRNKNPWPPWMNTVLLTRITGPFLCPVITLNQNLRCISL